MRKWKKAVSFLLAVVMALGTVLFKVPEPVWAENAEETGNVVTVLKGQDTQYLCVSGNGTIGGENILTWTQDNEGEAALQWEFEPIEGSQGVYFIKNKNSGKCLAAAGGNPAMGCNVIQWDKEANNNGQKWMVEKADEGECKYKIRNMQVGGYLTAKSGGNGDVTIQESADSELQLWESKVEIAVAERLTEDHLANAASEGAEEQYLAVSGGSANEGAELSTWTGAESNQAWSFQETETEGEYYIVNRSSGRAASAQNMLAGSRLVQKAVAAGDDAQIWSFIKTDANNTYRIRNKGTHLYLAADVSATGSRILQKNYDADSKLQLWKMKAGTEVKAKEHVADHAVKIWIKEGVTVTSSQGAAVESGQDVTFTLTPREGYNIENLKLLVNGLEQTLTDGEAGVKTCTITGVTKDLTVKAQADATCLNGYVYIPENDYTGRNQCLSPRIVESLDGRTMYCTFENGIPSEIEEGEYSFPVYKSEDKGQSWIRVGEVINDDNAHPDSWYKITKYTNAGAPEEAEKVSESTEGALRHPWSLQCCPQLFVLPEAMTIENKQLAAGTLLCAGVAVPLEEGAEKIADAGYGGLWDSSLDLYYSADEGKTWEFLNVIADVKEGNPRNIMGYDPVWEPFFLYHTDKDGNKNLICYYSDETDNTKKHSQKLVYKIWDSASQKWGEAVDVINLNSSGYGCPRPGMPIVAELRDGKWMVVFETPGMSGICQYQIADDPYHWDAADEGTKMPASGGSPYVYTMQDGTTIAGTGTDSEVFEYDAESASWTKHVTNVPAGYNRCYLQLSGGEFFITGTEGPGFASQNNKIFVKQVFAGEDHTLGEGEFTVTAKVDGGHGSINYSDRAYTFRENEKRTYVITPDEGYAVDKVTINGEGAEVEIKVDSKGEIGILSLAVQKDMEIAATFTSSVRDYLESKVPFSNDAEKEVSTYAAYNGSSNLFTWTGNGDQAEENQYYKFQKIEEGLYLLVSTNNGKAIAPLSISEGSKINFETLNEKNTRQQWVFEDAGDGYRYVRNVGSGLYLTTPRTQASDKLDQELALQEKAASVSDSQLWKMGESGKIQLSGEGAHPSVQYRITVEESEGGTVTADKTIAAKGDSVAFGITPDAGYVVNDVLVNGESVKDSLAENASGYTLNGIEADVTIQAVFGSSGDYRIMIDKAIVNGTVRADKAIVSPGAKDKSVTFTIIPKLGYLVKQFTVDGTDVTDQLTQAEDGTYTYKIEEVTDDVNIQASFERNPNIDPIGYLASKIPYKAGESEEPVYAAYSNSNLFTWTGEINQPDQAQTNQRWSFKAVTPEEPDASSEGSAASPEEPAKYILVNVVEEKAMSAVSEEKDSQICTAEVDETDPKQQWIFVKTDPADAYGWVKNAASGLYLTTPKDVRNNQSFLTLTDKLASDTQMWRTDAEDVIEFFTKDAPPAEVFYRISIAAGIVNGQVTADKETAKENETVTFTITPNQDYRIKTVTLNGMDYTNSVIMDTNGIGTLEWTVTEDVEISVVFEQKKNPGTDDETYTVTANVIGAGGSISHNAGEGKVAKDTEVTFTITPDQDYSIKTVTLNGTDCTASVKKDADGIGTLKVTVTENIEMKAAFEQKKNPGADEETYTVTANVIGAGGSISHNAGEGKVAKDTEVIFTITPEEKYTIDTVTVNGIAATAVELDAETGIGTLKVTVTEDITVSVSFKAKSGEEKPNPSEEDRNAANEVIRLIQAIGTVQNTEACQKSIAAARAAYAKLTPEQQKLVTNYNVLTAAEKEYNRKVEEAKKKAQKGTVSIEEAQKAVTSANTDKSDVSGSKYSALKVKAKGGNKSVSLSWSKVKGASGYLVFGAKYGKKMKLLKELPASKKSFKITKLSKGTYYKYIVAAYQNIMGEKRVTETSVTVHVCTTGGKKKNPTGITNVKSKINIKKGKSVTLKPKLKPVKNVASRMAKFRYESSNPAVATVNKKGKITGKKKGNCYIYVYTQNGISKKVKVTVKK